MRKATLVILSTIAAGCGNQAAPLPAADVPRAFATTVLSSSSDGPPEALFAATENCAESGRIKWSLNAPGLGGDYIWSYKLSYDDCWDDRTGMNGDVTYAFGVDADGTSTWNWRNGDLEYAGDVEGRCEQMDFRGRFIDPSFTDTTLMHFDGEFCGESVSGWRLNLSTGRVYPQGDSEET